MTNETATSTTVAKEAKKENLGLINLGENFRGLIVTGGQRVPSKLIDIAAEIADWANIVGGHLIFQYAKPKGKRAFTYSDLNTIVINLGQIAQDALEACLTRGSDVEFVRWDAAIWADLIVALAHEFHHLGGLQRGIIDPDDEQQVKAAEAEANIWAAQTLRELAKKYDIELPEHLVAIGALMDEYFQDEDPEDEFTKRMTEMTHEGTIYDDGIWQVCSIRGWIRATVDPKERDPEWDQPILPIRVEPIGELDTNPVQTSDGVMLQPGVNVDRMELDDLLEMGEPMDEDEEMELVGLEEGITFTANAPEVQQAMSGTALMSTPQVQTPSPAAPAPQPVAPQAPVQQQTPAGPFVGDTVQLHPQAQAHMAQFQQAANASTVPVPAAPRELPNYGYDPEVMKVAVKEIYHRCYAALFTMTGWQPFNHPNDTFPEKKNIGLQPVRIDDILARHNVPGLVHEFHAPDANGQVRFQEVGNSGCVRGEVFQNAQMPGFRLVFNFNGVSAKRVIVPQNPNKTSRLAEEARQGIPIVHIINGDVKDDSDSSKWVAKIRNNEWIAG